MKFKEGDLSRDTFGVLMYDLECLQLEQTESNTYHLNLLIANLKDVFGFKVKCLSCGQWLKEEDFINSHCNLCHQEVK